MSGRGRDNTTVDPHHANCGCRGVPRSGTHVADRSGGVVAAGAASHGTDGLRACRRLAAATAVLVLLARPTVCVALGAEPTTGPARDDPSGRRLAQRQDDAVESRPIGKGGGDDTYDWLRTIGALAAVVALIFIARLLLRRLAGGAASPGRGVPIEVLARANLSARQQLSLVRLGRRLVLVGSGPTGIRPLAEVTDPDEVAELLGELRGGRGGQGVRGLTERIRSRLSSGSEES